MKQNLQVTCFKGRDILPYVRDLAELRINIFREYPYRYNGNLEYETHYLQTYIDCPESIFVIVFDNTTIVGVSTALPLVFAAEEFQQPFKKNNFDVTKIFYFGESVLLPAYRGQQLYRTFFSKREEAAYAYGSCYTTFCAIERPHDDPKKPANYVALDSVWQHFGYNKHPELQTLFLWQEIDEASESAKTMVFWMKKL